MAIDHEPWKGSLYKKPGLNGQRIAVVGHSHYREPGVSDHVGYTRSVMQEYLGGAGGYSFFESIRAYFGYGGGDRSDLWNRVLFFNFLPRCVGTTNERYQRGTEAEIASGCSRLLKLMETHRPHKVLVFSNSFGKGWQTFPPTLEEQNGRQCPRLNGFPQFSWGTYPGTDTRVRALGLRHPQGARKSEMTKAVQYIMSLPLEAD